MQTRACQSTGVVHPIISSTKAAFHYQAKTWQFITDLCSKAAPPRQG